MRFIGSKSKIFLNEKTENSQTSLVLAAQRGHIGVVEQLLDLKADFTITDDSDRTVLHYSIAYPDILKLLVKVNGLSLTTAFCRGYFAGGNRGNSPQKS